MHRISAWHRGNSLEIIQPDAFLSLVLHETPLIDVRAPGEFKSGALPGAVNVPLLDDEQRHQVGLTYRAKGQAAAIA